MTELVVAPRDERVCEALDKAPGWAAYAAQLHEVVKALAVDDSLEIVHLLVNDPLPSKYAGLCLGARVGAETAADLVVDMAAGHGPYCGLASRHLVIESGWDGAIHFFVTREAEGLTALGGSKLTLEWRETEPESMSALVETPADETFWARVWGETTLLCERWAHGRHGTRWFLVTSENAGEMAAAVRPRSLLGFTVDPDLTVRPELSEDAFTLFRGPLEPGELGYRAFPLGTDDLAKATTDGFALMLPESALGDWAVVPDGDGIVRGQWENPGNV